MPRVFISYRRAVDNYAAAGIYTELVRRFGAKHIFRAPETLHPGDDFPAEITEALRQSAALVAVIDPSWIGEGPDGRRYLNDPSGWVRREIATAFTRGIRVLPVLLANTPIPAADELPGDIRRLRDKQIVRLPADGGPYKLQPLVDELARVLGLPKGAVPQPREDQRRRRTDARVVRGGVTFNAPVQMTGGDIVAGDKHVWGSR
jgi:hypothetical protein